MISTGCAGRDRVMSASNRPDTSVRPPSAIVAATPTVAETS